MSDQHPAGMPAAGQPTGTLERTRKKAAPKKRSGNPNAGLTKRMDALSAELSEIAAALQRRGVPRDCEQYVTSREQLNAYCKIIERRNGELADGKFMRMMEQLCAMREDFFRLCNGMEGKIDSFSSRDVLESFRAYEVDMENILLDAGVSIGPYGSDRLDTKHQRIVEVVPTDDPSKNMTISERLADGYEYGGRAILKERVNVFKAVEQEAPAQADGSGNTVE